MNYLQYMEGGNAVLYSDSLSNATNYSSAQRADIKASNPSVTWGTDVNEHKNFIQLFRLRSNDVDNANSIFNGVKNWDDSTEVMTALRKGLRTDAATALKLMQKHGSNLQSYLGTVLNPQKNLNWSKSVPSVTQPEVPQEPVQEQPSTAATVLQMARPLTPAVTQPLQEAIEYVPTAFKSTILPLDNETTYNQGSNYVSGMIYNPATYMRPSYLNR